MKSAARAPPSEYPISVKGVVDHGSGEERRTRLIWVVYREGE